MSGSNKANVRIKFLSSGARVPERSTLGSAGYDLVACVEEPIVLGPGETKLIGCGFSMAFDQGYVALIFARSGLGVRHGIVPANCVGVIDSDYRGEVKVGLTNHSDASFAIEPGSRIAQLVIVPCMTSDFVVCGDLNDTQRGDGGFGSTGLDAR